MGNRIGRFWCAGLLLFAAAMKSFEVLSDPAVGTLYGSRWLSIVLIQYEIFLASWLLSGAGQRACRSVAIATFSTFGCYSLYIAGAGATSCGCFGRMTVNPWWIFAVDCTTLALLWRWKPVARSGRFAHFTVGASLSAIISGCLLAIVIAQPRATLADGIEVTDTFIVLEPEKWIGKRFHLSEHIDIGGQLLAGDWTVVLYHHDCSRCQRALSQLSSRQQDGQRSFGQLAIVEVPPFGALNKSGLTCGRLSGNRAWAVVTPVVISVSNGHVMAVRGEDDMQVEREK